MSSTARHRPIFDTPVTRLLGIRYPIIQGAMAWLSEAELVAAVSNQGGLGVLGTATMSVDELEVQVKRTKTLTDRPFAVNFPLVLGKYDEHLEMALGHGVRIIFMSAGSPKLLTPRIKAAGAICVHVVPNLRLAESAVRAGVDALVLESWEAGGHLSPEGITGMTNIRHVSQHIKVPLIAAGGIADGFQMAAALCMGAQGVQMGTRFIATQESNAPERYRRMVLDAKEDDIPVFSKHYHPSRALRSPVVNKLLEMEGERATVEDVRTFIGRGRARKAAHYDNLEEGIFYAGSSAVLVGEVLSVAQVFERILGEYQEAIERLTLLTRA